MLSFIFEGPKLVKVSERYVPGATTRNDLHSFPVAEFLAQQATELTGDVHVATDNGPNHHPRYDVVRAPKVGDLVSYSFNGDTTPCGQVTRVSESLRRVETSEGRVFYRVQRTGCWRNNGTWSLVGGHRHERNPSF